MKKTLKDLNPKKYNRIVGIDSSTTGIAICLLDEGRPANLMYVKLPAGLPIMERLHKARDWFAPILELERPDFVMIEAPIFVQNPLTSKNLAYVVGILIGECVHKNIPVDDVMPATWKYWMGYKKVTKAIQNDIIERLGVTEGRKEIQRLRKSQIQDILRGKYPTLNWDNDNIADAAGVALYANCLYGENDEFKKSDP